MKQIVWGSFERPRGRACSRTAVLSTKYYLVHTAVRILSAPSAALIAEVLVNLTPRHISAHKVHRQLEPVWFLQNL